MEQFVQQIILVECAEGKEREAGEQEIFYSFIAVVSLQIKM